MKQPNSPLPRDVSWMCGTSEKCLGGVLCATPFMAYG